MSSGGFRKGAGRKPLYGEATKLVSTRVPISKIPKFKKAAADLLKTWEKIKTKPKPLPSSKK